jgi:serine/threonine protein kinase
MQMLSKTSTAATLKSRYDVDWDNPLGEGAFGAVYLCTNRDTGQKYALKKISKRLTNKASFMREIDALMHIRESGGHPNICRLIENFDEGEFYCLVLDLISGGELFDQLARSGPYSEADAARLVREVASALAYLHGVGIVHSDLKPEVSV